jgi:hypothetical protein
MRTAGVKSSNLPMAKGQINGRTAKPESLQISKPAANLDHMIKLCVFVSCHPDKIANCYGVVLQIAKLNAPLLVTGAVANSNGLSTKSTSAGCGLSEAQLNYSDVSTAPMQVKLNAMMLHS